MALDVVAGGSEGFIGGPVFERYDVGAFEAEPFKDAEHEIDVVGGSDESPAFGLGEVGICGAADEQRDAFKPPLVVWSHFCPSC